jgi:hypothetical protein
MCFRIETPGGRKNAPTIGNVRSGLVFMGLCLSVWVI